MNPILKSSLFITLSVCLFQACSQQPEKAPETAAAPTPAAPAAATQEIPVTSPVATKVVAAPATETPPAAPAAPEPAAPAAVASPLMQSLAKAKALVGEQKYTEAASVLASINSQDLSGDQKTLWQSLQDQIQTALAAQTTKSAADQAKKSLGGLLGK